MTQDLMIVLYWWLFITGIGLIFLPLTRKIFPNFFDQGYLFSKIIGILFSSYLVWLLASLKILPFFKETIWLVLIIGIVFNLLISNRKTKTPPSPNHHHLSPLIYIFEELMFLSTLVFWSFVRGFQPDIQGLEKFMDFGFVNSILKSRYFPPADMWFAGKSINYYYFGHYVTAFLTKLSGIDSAVTYNLMIATLFAFCFSLTFSLTGNLTYFLIIEKFKNLKIDFKFQISNFKLIIISGLISAFLISLGANLHPAYYNLKMKVFNKPYCDGATTYWYPNATRYIGYCPDVEDKTIHEFPAYSFIVSDLHGHVSNIPFVLTFLALCFTLLIKIKENKDLSLISLLTSHFSLPLLLAIFYMTNQWDYPIYLMVLGFTLLWGFSQHYGWTNKTLLKSVPLGLVIIAGSIPFILPFQLNFNPIVQGIAFVKAHSLPHQLLILWGVPWFFGLTFLIFLFGRYLNPTRRIGEFKKESLIKWFSKIMGVEVELKTTHPHIPPSTHNPLLTLTPDWYILILLLVSTLLIFIPEIIYVKDIYIGSYHRANTMFKLTYQSFVMFSVCIGYIFIRILSSLKKGFVRKLLLIAYCLLLIALLVYPNYSIPGYYGKLEKQNYKGLYGLNFLNRLYPDDYKLVNWLNNNVAGQPVVLEAVGDSYTDYERISMATGLPTIEGWLVHEWLWQGSYDEPGKRAGEVQTIYESEDINLTKSLLEQYQVKYIVVGEMERTKYPNLNEEKIKSLGKEVFKSGKTNLYEFNK
ncbi:hypothetical protein COS55_02685 [Candidatus Shapirobacteria bacterium CG03_land_8_20_14_0_80_40_19]|uniref:YYY membrane protein n=3 Tax=Candidatus Shapironibacteriota TaxID=1752721 RepID=A0A2M7BD17_9BACT|nr:MAG: hypothetical protein COS55_02685 [Candidatus Shapirobacteria bacterium CG03_land_8_20_14_0_80_40_19]PJC76181.1 MAG: hypothetical protein CO010_03140 [Candidatus Shapirobacteria bacterium CG_4_8_14_3_um_filter_39_11]